MDAGPGIRISDFEWNDEMIIGCNSCRSALTRSGAPSAARVARYGGPTPAKEAALAKAIEARALEVEKVRADFFRVTEAEAKAEEEAQADAADAEAAFRDEVLDDDERAEASKLASGRSVAARFFGKDQPEVAAVGQRIEQRRKFRGTIGRIGFKVGHLVQALMEQVKEQCLVSVSSVNGDDAARHDAWRCVVCGDPDHSALKGERFFVEGLPDLVCKGCALDAATAAPAPQRRADTTGALRLRALDDDADLIEATTSGGVLYDGAPPSGDLVLEASRVLAGADHARKINQLRADVVSAIGLPPANRDATTRTFAIARPLGAGLTDRSVVVASSKDREAPDAVGSHVFLRCVAAACKREAFTAEAVAPLLDAIEDGVPMNEEVRDFLGDNCKEVAAAWARVACSRRNKRIAHHVFSEASLRVWWHAEQRAAITVALRDGATGFEAVSLHQECCGFCAASFSALGAVTSKGAIPAWALPPMVGPRHRHSLIAVQYNGVQEECCVECAAWRVLPAGVSFEEGTFACHKLPGLSCAAPADLYEEEDEDDEDGPASKRSRAA